MADFFGGFESAPPKKQSGDFTRGLKQSFQEIKGTGFGALGLAGAGLGIDGLKQYGLENAQAAFDASAAMSKPTDQLEGIESFGDAADYLQRGLGYVAGQVIPSIATGGVGALIAKKVAQYGVQSLTKAEAELLIRSAVQRGAVAGAGAGSYVQEAGSIYPEMVKEGHDEPGRAAAFALPAAALDIIPEARVISKFLSPAANPTRGLLRNVLQGGATQAGIEGITEIAQTGVERAAAYKPLASPEAFSEYANAGALGALGGGVIGGMSAAVQQGRPASLLATGNPEPGQLELPLPPGGGAAPNLNADTLDVGPAFNPQVQTGAQAGLFDQPFNGYTPEAQGKVDPNFVSANDVFDRLGGQRANPSPIIVPGQPEPTIVETNRPDTRTAAGIAFEKEQRGELLTPFERALLRFPPETPPVATAQPFNQRALPPEQGSLFPVDVPSTVVPGQPAAPQRNVLNNQVNPTQGELFYPNGEATYAATDAPPPYRRMAREHAALVGYKMTAKRAPIAEAAEELHATGRLAEADYDQIHELLRQSKYARAQTVLANTAQAEPIPDVAPPAPAPAPTPTPAPAALRATLVPPPARGAPPAPAVPTKRPARMRPIPQEVYENNHQEGEPTYEELSAEDREIWNNTVEDGQGSIAAYDSFQRRLKRNAKAEERAKSRKVEDDDESPRVTRESEIKAIDQEIAALKQVLKCIG